jgi:hypothetical protein
MGGLIARTGAATGRDLALAWVNLLTDVITLGTPHLGADLARLAGGASHALAMLPETAAFGKLLDRRSVGIKDLEVGLPDQSPLPGVHYRLVSAELDPPWGPLVGDLLVRRGSATGRTRESGLFPGADHLHLLSTGHLGLLHHPDVHSSLREWLR